MLLVGTRKGLVRFDGDRVVGVDFAGVPVQRAARCDGALFAALDHGHWGQKLHRSDDEGATWAEQSVAYPSGTGASVESIWELADGRVPGRVWLGTNPGGLFRSDDGGATWTLNQALWDHPSRPSWFGGGRDTAGIHTVLVDPRDPDHIYVGISCAGVFETRDGGATWHPRSQGLRADFLPDPAAEIGQDPHRVVFSSDPDVLWQQNHCGIWKSTDGAATWVEVSARPAHFGFGIVADGPDTAWVVPAISDEERRAVDARMRVCRTEDGGATWQELTRGLPQEHCFDLVYRHALARRGDTLVMGSTTGNLWISHDRGESWRALTHHLAPIYSVEFA